MPFYVNYRATPEAKGFCKTYLSHEATLILIDSVRQHEHLWNEHDECYDFSGQIQVSWNSIILRLFNNGCSDADLAIDTWRNLYLAYHAFLQGKVVQSSNDREYLNEIGKFVSGLVDPKDCCFDVTQDEFQNFPVVKQIYLRDRTSYEYQRNHQTRETSGSNGAAPGVHGASSNSMHPEVPDLPYHELLCKELQYQLAKIIHKNRGDFVEQVLRLKTRVNDLFHLKMNIEMLSIENCTNKGDYAILNALTTEHLYEIEQGIDTMVVRFGKGNINLADEKTELSKLEKDTDDVVKHLLTLKKLSEKPVELKQKSINSQSTLPRPQSDQSESSQCSGFGTVNRTLSKSWDPASCETLVQTHQFTKLSKRVSELINKHLATAMSTAQDKKYKGNFALLAESTIKKLVDIQQECITNLGLCVERDYDNENGKQVLLKLTKEVDDVEKSLDALKKLTSEEQIDKCSSAEKKVSSIKPSQKTDELKNFWFLSKSESNTEGPKVQTYNKVSMKVSLPSAEDKLIEVPLSTKVPTVSEKIKEATLAHKHGDIEFVPYENVLCPIILETTGSSGDVAGFVPTESIEVAAATQPRATEAPVVVLKQATVTTPETPNILDPVISTEQTSAVIQDQSITMNTLIEPKSTAASNSEEKSSNLIEEVDKKIKILISMKTVLTTVENSHELSKRIDRKIEALEQSKVNIIKDMTNQALNTPKIEMNEVVEPLKTEAVEEVLPAAPEPATTAYEVPKVIQDPVLNTGVANPEQPVVTGNAGEVIQDNSLTTTEHFIIHIMSVFIVIFLYHYFTVELN